MSLAINTFFPQSVQAGTTCAIQAYNGGFGASPPGGVTLTLQSTPPGETHNITSFTSWSDTEIRFVLPTITNIGDSWAASFTAVLFSNSLAFFPFVDGSGYNISMISPNPATAGQTITLTGTFPPTQGTGFGYNLQNGNSVPIPVSTWSGSSITFVLPGTLIGGFPPGFVQTIELWDNGHFPLVPPGIHATILLNVEANPTITETVPSPLIVARNQSFEVVGSFFGYQQGSTTIQFNTVGLGRPCQVVG